MILRFTANWTRFGRSFFFAILVVLLFMLPQTAVAEDGSIFVNGDKIDSLYRFKKGVKYLPVEKVAYSLGLEAFKKGRKWVIRGGGRGEISIAERSNKVISRDGILFISESFWRNSVGVEVIERGNTVYVTNRIVDIKKYPDGLIIIAAAPIKCTSFTLDNPYRTVYDFKNLAIGQEAPEVKFGFRDVPFSAIRLGQFEANPYIGRVVIDHTSPRFKPVAGIQGRFQHIFWIGNREFTYEQEEKVPDAIFKSAETLLSIGKDGNLYFKGVKFDSVSGFYLWDKEPYRAVFDLKGCTLPFNDERVFQGRGNINRVRISQFKPDIARIVVELDVIQPMSYYIISKNELQMFFSTRTFKSGLRVLIDPGHGGKDPGAVVTKKQMGGLFADEKTVNMKLSLELGRILTERGVQVYYTRADDKFIRLEDRRDMATKMGVDLFVSIHTNALPKTPQTCASGGEVYYYYKRDKELAHQVAKFMAWRTGYKGRGTFFRPLIVIMNEKIPSILVEAGFLDNPKDLAALLDPKGTYGRNAMVGVADAIAKVLGADLEAKPIKLAQMKPTEEKPKEPEKAIFKPNIRLGHRFKKFALDVFEPPELISRDTSNRDKAIRSETAEDKIPEKKEAVAVSTQTAPTKSKSAVKAPEIKQPAATAIQHEAIEFVDKAKQAVEWTEDELRKRRSNIFKLY